MEQLQQIDIVRLLPKMLLEEEVDGTLEHESVVDGDVADTWLKVIAGAVGEDGR
jgi:hypothetical protein